ncbi:MAG: RagB/SusD family nutrient uptake outer membrane protein [Bacteroidales bacterium]|nr:RagB/SusD family nutrient uptake outer membrane protein [Bacteroidales bacterium]
MKKISYSKYILVALALVLGSCEFLDYDEVSYNRKDDVFSDFGRSKSFLTGIYSRLPTDFNSIDGAMRSSATDEAEHVWDLSNVQRFNNGSWSAINPLDDVWADMYAGIRAVNLFLEETEGQEFIEEQYNEDYSEMMEQFRMYPYEARFLRAFFYFELIKRYKDVPLITGVLTPEAAQQVVQSSFNDVVAFIVSECDSAAAVLPADYGTFSSAQETGRATKGAALALKSRVLLYAASPLHNTSNELSRWEAAAVAAKEIIDSAWYDLEASYSNVVNNHTSTELILGRREGETNGFERRNFPVGFEGGNTGTCPTQNLVNAYEMVETGLPIGDPSSGFDTIFPYSGRDPRLEQTVLLNNSIWKGKVVESFVGGANGPPRANATKTGYYLKKYVIESVSLEPTNTTRRQHTWVLFRYAEVLLNYAEAMNEAYGPEDAAGLGMTALQAVNQVRIRAGMPEFPVGMSQSAFAEKLRNERRVELAFEDHRFWDVRRWMIGDATTEIHGVRITQNPYGGFAYQQFRLEERVFEDRMNLYPIPQSEIYKNPALEQNTGW